MQLNFHCLISAKDSVETFPILKEVHTRPVVGIAVFKN